MYTQIAEVDRRADTRAIRLGAETAKTFPPKSRGMSAVQDLDQCDMDGVADTIPLSTGCDTYHRMS